MNLLTHQYLAGCVSEAVVLCFCVTVMSYELISSLYQSRLLRLKRSPVPVNHRRRPTHLTRVCCIFRPFTYQVEVTYGIGMVLTVSPSVCHIVIQLQ